MRRILRITIIAVLLGAGIPLAVLTAWYELTTPPQYRQYDR